MALIRCPECGGQLSDQAKVCVHCGYPIAEINARLARQEWAKSVGKMVTFGTYPQTAAGEDNTPIEWLVLDYDEARNKALLVSRYGLDTKLYNEEDTTVTWENCSLRRWLNNNFYNKAFSAKEQSAICITSVDNSSSQGHDEWSTSGGKDTQDKVFLLSCTEAKKYFKVSDDKNNKISRVKPTEYAFIQGAWKNGNAGWWTLRSPGPTQNRAATVYHDGSLNYGTVDLGYSCVRPAIWLDLESDFSQSGLLCTPYIPRSVGDVLTFGVYPQTTEGDDQTPIEWVIFDCDKENNKVLLMSKYALDMKPYNTENEDVTWETCTLRNWLNNDFLSKAFNSKEQSAILETTVDNSSSQGYNLWKTSGGNDTLDRVFLFSIEEMKEYLKLRYYNKNTEARTEPTAYAIKNGAWTSKYNKTADDGLAARYWLRSPGENKQYAAYVDNDGSLLGNGPVLNSSVCIRPVLWVDLNSDIF